MLQRTPDRRRLCILVVEDHELLRKLFSEAFRDRHEVHTAADAEEGWRLYLDRNPEVVFLDIGLPEANGHDLARRIKERNPNTYVIMATASDHEDDVDEAERNNADGFIVKPFDKHKVNGYIDRYMNGSRSN